jgi:hypothetical protein
MIAKSAIVATTYVAVASKSKTALERPMRTMHRRIKAAAVYRTARSAGDIALIEEAVNSLTEPGESTLDC